MKKVFFLFLILSNSILLAQKQTIFEILQPYFGNVPIKNNTSEIISYINSSYELKIDTTASFKVFNYLNDVALLTYFNVDTVYGRGLICQQNIFIDSITKMKDTVDFLVLYISFNQNTDLEKIVMELHNKIKKCLKYFKVRESGFVEKREKEFRYFSSKKEKGHFISVKYFKNTITNINTINISITKLASYNRRKQ